MKVSLTLWHDSATCTWCEKDKECVTTDFGDGFIRNSNLCWACLRKAMKVRAKQTEKTPESPSQ